MNPPASQPKVIALYSLGSVGRRQVTKQCPGCAGWTFHNDYLLAERTEYHLVLTACCECHVERYPEEVALRTKVRFLRGAVAAARRAAA